jgi:hypothetical protein
MANLGRTQPNINRVNFPLNNIRIGISAHERVNERFPDRQKSPDHLLHVSDTPGPIPIADPLDITKVNVV